MDKPVNLSMMLEGALAAEMAADDIKTVLPLPVQVAMLTGCIKAVTKILLDADVHYEVSHIASARAQIIEAAVVASSR